MTEGGIDPAVLTPVLHYDGAPITARFLIDAIGKRLTVAREAAE